jgi:hypothetical protein
MITRGQLGPVASLSILNDFDFIFLYAELFYPTRVLTLSRRALETFYRKKSRARLKERLLLILKVEGDGMIPSLVAKELHRPKDFTAVSLDESLFFFVSLIRKIWICNENITSRIFVKAM